MPVGSKLQLIQASGSSLSWLSKQPQLVVASLSFAELGTAQPQLVFTFSQLPRHLKNEVYTVFNSPACAKSKSDKMCILGLELAITLQKVLLGITFVEIECDLVII